MSTGSRIDGYGNNTGCWPVLIIATDEVDKKTLLKLIVIYPLVDIEAGSIPYLKIYIFSSSSRRSLWFSFL